MSTEREAIMLKALHEIANPALWRLLGNSATWCNCEHDTEDCCARVGYYCPSCIAGKALLDLGEDIYGEYIYAD